LKLIYFDKYLITENYSQKTLYILYIIIFLKIIILINKIAKNNVKILILHYIKMTLDIDIVFINITLNNIINLTNTIIEYKKIINIFINLYEYLNIM